MISPEVLPITKCSVDGTAEPPRKRVRTEYGHGTEARSVQMEIGDFDYLSSQAHAAIIHYFGTTLKLRELKGIVVSIRAFLESKHGIHLPQMSRNTKRSYPLMIKYIQDNLDAIVPVFPVIELLDERRNPVSLCDAHKYVAFWVNVVRFVKLHCFVMRILGKALPSCHNLSVIMENFANNRTYRTKVRFDIWYYEWKRCDRSKT